jgi:hypothetical protein
MQKSMLWGLMEEAASLGSRARNCCYLTDQSRESTRKLRAQVPAAGKMRLQKI